MLLIECSLDMWLWPDPRTRALYTTDKWARKSRSIGGRMRRGQSHVWHSLIIAAIFKPICRRIKCTMIYLFTGSSSWSLLNWIVVICSSPGNSMGRLSYSKEKKRDIWKLYLDVWSYSIIFQDFSNFCYSWYDFLFLMYSDNLTKYSPNSIKFEICQVPLW